MIKGSVLLLTFPGSIPYSSGETRLPRSRLEAFIFNLILNEIQFLKAVIILNFLQAITYDEAYRHTTFNFKLI